MGITKEKEEEMNRLYGPYELMLPKLLKKHLYEFVLLTRHWPPQFYKNFQSASEEGVEKYGLEKIFLIQEILDFEPFNYIASAIV